MSSLSPRRFAPSPNIASSRPGASGEMLMLAIQRVQDAIDAENNKTMIDPFQKLKGAAFDHRYVREMIAGHTKAIAIYKKEAADAQNPVLKSYAEDALPVLEKHLAGAKDLEKAKVPEKSS